MGLNLLSVFIVSVGYTTETMIRRVTTHESIKILFMYVVPKHGTGYEGRSFCYKNSNKVVFIIVLCN